MLANVTKFVSVRFSKLLTVSNLIYTLKKNPINWTHSVLVVKSTDKKSPKFESL